VALLAGAASMLTTGLYAASTVAAQASATRPAVHRVQNRCHESGRFCIWTNTGFGGEKGSFAGSNGNWNDLHSNTCRTRNWNNCASSAFNNKTSHAVNLWETTGDKGGSFCVAPLTGYSNFGNHHFNNGDGLNNAVSADFLEPGTTC
jgi:peptidase inhibitor family I36